MIIDNLIVDLYNGIDNFIVTVVEIGINLVPGYLFIMLPEDGKKRARSLEHDKFKSQESTV